MKHIRTLIADDEPAARARLARLLAQDPEIELVAECRNGQEAVEAVGKHRPDLLFLDVQMPQVNGFDVLHQLSQNGSRERMPFVVFVTAHDQYALKAFDVNAVDFLLKPYDDERFHASLEKARKWIELRMNSKLTGRLMDLMREHMHSSSEYTEVFVIRDKGREHKVPVDEIVFLRAEGNYLHLQLKEKHRRGDRTGSRALPAHPSQLHREQGPCAQLAVQWQQRVHFHDGQQRADHQRSQLQGVHRQGPAGAVGLMRAAGQWPWAVG